MISLNTWMRPGNWLIPAAFLLLVLTCPAFAGETSIVTHAVAMNEKPKYGPDFTHTDYVNPDAPKGGTIRQARIGGWDSFNPFIAKGSSAAGLAFMYDSLAVSSDDEPFTQYGLVAERIEYPEDRSWVIFHLNPNARFHDGKQVTAEDIVFSFEAVMKWGRPNYRQYYASVEKAAVLDNGRVKFTFKPGKNLEMPLIMSQLQVLPKHYWNDRDFSRSTLEVPLGGGPYKIGKFTAGKSITYERVKDYWAKDHPINKGQYNYDFIEFEYLRDVTVATEAFKKGAFDFKSVSVKDWNTRMEGRNFDRKLIVKKTIPYNKPQGMRGYVFNLRKPLFTDRRVRQAISLVFDFNWINQRFFYGEYDRNNSYFDNSEFAATGMPSEAEYRILSSYGTKLPPGVITEPVAQPGSAGTGNSRTNLRKAAQLLKSAGWTVKGGKLMNAETGQPFRFSMLFSSKSQTRYIGSFRKNLKRLGIELTLQVVDTAQYIERIRKFDYDMIFRRIPQSDSPGNEQREYWHSETAVVEGSKNYIGIRDSVVDDLIARVISAPDRQTLIHTTKALDRLLLWQNYTIHIWQSDRYRVAYWDKFEQPEYRPTKSFGLYTWWINSDKEARIAAHQKRSF